MYSKVLIADDLGSINQGVISVLDKLGVSDSKQVQYCDDAYLQIKKGISDKKPYQLLITDLSFKLDHRLQKLSSGDQLIDQISKEHPDLPIIVYSVEDRLQRVKKLIKLDNVIAYVNKGRKGLKELKQAISVADNSNQYISQNLQELLDTRQHLDFTDYDIKLLSLLAEGQSQSDISKAFNTSKITPSSLSAVEKRLNMLKVEFRAKNTTNLIAIVKDLGLI